MTRPSSITVFSREEFQGDDLDQPARQDAGPEHQGPRLGRGSQEPDLAASNTRMATSWTWRSFWSPLTFEGVWSASPWPRCHGPPRAAHRNAQFNKLSRQFERGHHRLGSAMFIWKRLMSCLIGRFCLDLYFEEKDEVVSLLTITTVDDSAS